MRIGRCGYGMALSRAITGTDSDSGIGLGGGTIRRESEHKSSRHIQSAGRLGPMGRERKRESPRWHRNKGGSLRGRFGVAYDYCRICLMPTGRFLERG